MEKYKFSPPVTEEGWYVFKDAILSGIDTSDCNDTVNGYCQSAKNYKECLNICKSYPNCYYGYFIETPDQDNICVPLKAREQRTYPYRLRNKSYYPILNKMKTHVFFIGDYPYPPQMPNALFYGDKFFATVGNDGGSNLTPIGLTKSGINFTSSIDIQFLPSKVNRTEVENYVTVKEGDEVIISIPNTSFVLRGSDSKTSDPILGLESGALKWQQQASLLSIPENVFNIHCLDTKATTLNYSQKFYLTYKGKIVSLVSSNGDTSLKTTDLDISTAIKQGEKVVFTFTPKIQAYYCDGECKSIPLEQTEMKEENAFYKGSPVYRSPVCWNICQPKLAFHSQGKKSNLLLILPPLLILLLLILLSICFLWPRSP